MKLFLSILLIAVCSGFLHGQARPKPKATPVVEIVSVPPVDVAKAAGKFTANGYENGWLGFSVTPPAGWQPLNDAVNEATFQQGSQRVMENRSKATVEALEKSVSNSRVLFQFVPRSGGASLAAGIEQVPSGYDSRAYALSGLQLFKGVAGVKVVKDVYVRSVAGRVWQAFEIENTLNGQAFGQLYLMRVDKGIALFFITTLADPVHAIALMDSLNTIKFDR